MSGLLTQVIRRQALMMMPRRHESALLIAGPPAVKVTNTVIRKLTFRKIFSNNKKSFLFFRKN